MVVGLLCYVCLSVYLLGGGGRGELGSAYTGVRSESPILTFCLAISYRCCFVLFGG